MSKLYLLCNPLVADDFNMSLMRLLCPASRAAGNTTKFLAVKHIHPETGYAALAMDENQTVPIDPEATGDELNYMLNIFVNDGALTQEEADGVRQQVLDSLGESVSILDFVPPTWSGYVLTKQQMDATGWFPQLEEEEGNGNVTR